MNTNAPQQEQERTVARRFEIPRPLGLLISFLRDAKGTAADERRHIRDFIKLLDEPGYEEFRNAIIDEWARIKYSTAYQAAHPPTMSELKSRQQQRKRASANERKTIDDLKSRLLSRALTLIMPNGKTLAKCTGAQCIEFGGWLIKVGERVGPHRLVGDVLTNKDLARIATQ